jgi:hypothetical protein
VDHQPRTLRVSIIGAWPVAAIDTTLVLKVLEPIWQATPVSASRVRGRIESVLDWAKTRDYRSGENPARWKGHLENLLAKKAKLARRSCIMPRCRMCSSVPL